MKSMLVNGDAGRLLAPVILFGLLVLLVVPPTKARLVLAGMAEEVYLRLCIAQCRLQCRYLSMKALYLGFKLRKLSTQARILRQTRKNSVNKSKDGNHNMVAPNTQAQPRAGHPGLWQTPKRNCPARWLKRMVRRP